MSTISLHLDTVYLWCIFCGMAGSETMHRQSHTHTHKHTHKHTHTHSNTHTHSKPMNLLWFSTQCYIMLVSSLPA